MGVNLGATLPPLLAKKKWTQERLAAETGIRRTDINALANGRLDAGRSRLERIAAALEVSVLELGAPLGEADEAGQTLVDRLEELAATLAETLERQKAQDAELKRLRARVRKLEAPSAGGAAAPRRPRKVG